jgi:solute carrier family 35 protein E1
LPALLKPITESTTALKAASAGSAAEEPKTNMLLLAVYFVAWYALNVGYNITNKQVLNVFPLYATTAVAQLLVAWVWLLPQWIAGIRPVPKPSKANMTALQKVSLLHGLGHLVTVRCTPQSSGCNGNNFTEPCSRRSCPWVWVL